MPDRRRARYACQALIMPAMPRLELALLAASATPPHERAPERAQHATSRARVPMPLPGASRASRKRLDAASCDPRVSAWLVQWREPRLMQMRAPAGHGSAPPSAARRAPGRVAQRIECRGTRTREPPCAVMNTAQVPMPVRHPWSRPGTAVVSGARRRLASLPSQNMADPRQRDGRTISEVSAVLAPARRSGGTRWPHHARACDLRHAACGTGIRRAGPARAREQRSCSVRQFASAQRRRRPVCLAAEPLRRLQRRGPRSSAVAAPCLVARYARLADFDQPQPGRKMGDRLMAGRALPRALSPALTQ